MWTDPVGRAQIAGYLRHGRETLGPIAFMVGMCILFLCFFRDSVVCLLTPLMNQLEKLVRMLYQKIHSSWWAWSTRHEFDQAQF